MTSSRTKTDEQGAFLCRHVLPETKYWVYAKPGSLSEQGEVVPEPLETGDEGTRVDVGVLHVKKGLTLAGRLVCSDAKAPPRDTVLVVTSRKTGGSLERKLDDTGRFEFRGLTDGPVSVSVQLPKGRAPSGYRVSARNKCLDPNFPEELWGKLNGDITDLTILIEPGEEPKWDLYWHVDPALVAEFNEAKAGPITGVLPRP